MNTRHSTTTGHYDLCSNKKSQQVRLQTEFGTVCETWEVGKSPYDPEMLPSEVSALLRERINYYLFRGNSERDLEILDKVDEHATRLDCEWLAERAARLEIKARGLRKLIENLGGAQ